MKYIQPALVVVGLGLISIVLLLYIYAVAIHINRTVSNLTESSFRGLQIVLEDLKPQPCELTPTIIVIEVYKEQ